MWEPFSALSTFSPTNGFLLKLFGKKQEHESYSRRLSLCHICVDKYIFDVKNVEKPKREKQRCVENSAKKGSFVMTIFTCELGMRVVRFCLILFFYCKIFCSFISNSES